MPIVNYSRMEIKYDNPGRKLRLVRFPYYVSEEEARQVSMGEAEKVTVVYKCMRNKKELVGLKKIGFEESKDFELIESISEQI